MSATPVSATTKDGQPDSDTCALGRMVMVQLSGGVVENSCADGLSFSSVNATLTLRAGSEEGIIGARNSNAEELIEFSGRKISVCGGAASCSVSAQRKCASIVRFCDVGTDRAHCMLAIRPDRAFAGHDMSTL